MHSNAPEEGRAVSFVVCGLGRLGQACVVLLKEFGVSVAGVDRALPASWQTPNLSGLVDDLVIGDCSQAEVLKRAGAAHCRAALLVTDNERTNIAAAFAARSMNPNVRLIIRSAQENLNQLLREQMGNLVAFEPSQFSANVFALASLGETTRAQFEVGDAKIRVVRRAIEEGEVWRQGRPLSDLNTTTHRILSYATQSDSSPAAFHDWNPDDKIHEGDVITFIENADRWVSPAELAPYRAKKDRPAPTAAKRLGALRDRLKRLWRGGSQVRRVALASSMIMLILLIAGVFLFRRENPGVGWFDALNVSIVLAIGGFDNVFGNLHLPFPISPGLYFFSVAVTIASAVFLGILYAMITERILSARLQIARRRPRAPLAGHAIIIGMDVIGQRIAAKLADWRRPVIGLSEQPIDVDIPRDMPLQIGPLRETLASANVATAQSVIVVTDDEVANVEISLMTRSLNPDCTLVFRTAEQQFAKHVAALIPASTGISDYAVAAEAIAGAAFGENIFGAFHLDGRSILVTEYTVVPGDTLIDRLLAEIAYGYGLAPIVHQRGGETRVIPADDIRLEANDRLVVLATIDGLRRVETAQRIPATWFLRIVKSPTLEASFDACDRSHIGLRAFSRASSHGPSACSIEFRPLAASGFEIGARA